MQDQEAVKQADAATGAAPKASETKTDEKAVKTPRPSNCVVCNKSIKKFWYYKNNKFYCTKRCWKTTVKKEEPVKEGETAPSAAPAK